MSKYTDTNSEMDNNDPLRIATNFVVDRRNGASLLLPREVVLERSHRASIQLGEDLAEEQREIKAENEQNSKTLKKASSNRRLPRSIQVFDSAKLSDCLKKSESMDRDVKERYQLDIKMAQKHDGYRQIPKFRNIMKTMSECLSKFPNFADPIQSMQEEFALLNAGSYKDFRFAPILLDGVPGIGKTCFAQFLSKQMNVPFLRIGAGGLQHAAQITGTAAHWSNANSGLIFNLLASHDSAVGVLLLDEVDKVSDDDRYHILPALLDLLEPETSRQFKDVSLNLEMDASRLIILMTSNNISDISPALLSRASVFSIKEPDPAQRADIATQVHLGLCKQTKQHLTLDDVAVHRLSESDIDLRVLTRSVRSAFANALLTKSRLVKPFVRMSTGQKQRIGF